MNQRERDQKVVAHLKKRAEELTEVGGVTHVLAIDKENPNELLVMTATAASTFGPDRVRVLYSAHEAGNA